MTTHVNLTPELEAFARSYVDNGRFTSVSEMVRYCLSRFQQDEKCREEFDAMLDAVKEEAEREGVFSAEQVLAEMDEIIDNAGR